MGLVKRVYSALVTKITSQNLNDIQDSIIALEGQNLNTRLTTAESDIDALEAKLPDAKTISTSGNHATYTLTASKIYMLVVIKQNSTTSSDNGLYIISPYNGGNGTQITTVTAGACTVTADGLTLDVQSTKAYIACALVQLSW